MEANLIVGACRKHPGSKGWPCLSLADLSSFVPRHQPLPHLVHVPEGWSLLFGLSLEETLFLGMPCLQPPFQTALLTFTQQLILGNINTP